LPRRKKSVAIDVPMPSEDWWMNVCRAFGWIPEYYTPMQRQSEVNVDVKSASASTHVSGYEAELKEFCRRIVEALVPPGSGYGRMYVDLANKIYDVVEDKMSIADWFTQVRQTFGLRDIDLVHIIYRSLQGFKSPEMVKLRDSWWEYLKMLMQAYGPITV